jgi:hypothetical protein
VTARGLRERTKAREGVAVAGDRFRQVKVGLRTERPLQVVQIDHTKVDIMLVDDAIYLKPERPTLKRLFGQVRQDCVAAGLKPPSMQSPPRPALRSPAQAGVPPWPGQADAAATMLSPGGCETCG